MENCEIFVLNIFGVIKDFTSNGLAEPQMWVLEDLSFENLKFENCFQKILDKSKFFWGPIIRFLSNYFPKIVDFQILLPMDFQWYYRELRRTLVSEIGGIKMIIKVIIVVFEDITLKVVNGFKFWKSLSFLGFIKYFVYQGLYPPLSWIFKDVSFENRGFENNFLKIVNLIIVDYQNRVTIKDFFIENLYIL